MAQVIIYGGLRLDLDASVLSELGLTDGQAIPDEMVSRCIDAQARSVCSVMEVNKQELPAEAASICGYRPAAS